MMSLTSKIIFIIFLIVGILGLLDWTQKQITIFRLEQEIREDKKELKRLEEELQKLIEEEEKEKDGINQ